MATVTTETSSGNIPVMLMLSKTTEELLRKQVEKSGLEISSVADELLHDALSELEETVAGIQRGIDAALGGDEMDLEDFIKMRQEQRHLSISSGDVQKVA